MNRAHVEAKRKPELPPLVVGITGASGALLAVRTVEVLGELGVAVHLTYTSACRQVWPDEVGHALADDLAQWKQNFGVRVYNPDDFRAPMSSGSFLTVGMLIVPCSMRSVSAIAHGSSSNLLERAADVTIKEGRRLVLVPREAPLSAIHLENLLALARLGICILPPVPQFYTHPQTADEIIDRIARRAIAQMGMPEALPPEMRWRSTPEADA
ncbi:MAG TPA: UbiX family flavin prenyltransferase [Ktedonobacterales bacterium]|jgi:4-hydroxy-3-polyprenylbenzoate decarboxylase|nr:UbiX family flavin prenyltransferase [Ktedonobacterales bacterium]